MVTSSLHAGKCARLQCTMEIKKIKRFANSPTVLKIKGLTKTRVKILNSKTKVRIIVGEELPKKPSPAEEYYEQSVFNALQHLPEELSGAQELLS